MSREKPRILTREELRHQFLAHLVSTARYWEKESRAETSWDKVSGFLFSVLSTLDGCAGGLPGFAIVPIQTEEDAAYAREQGFDYPAPFGPDDLPEGVVDLGGSLHEVLHAFLDGKVPRPDGDAFTFGDLMAEEAARFRAAGQ
jgi:hypothetical protein